MVEPRDDGRARGSALLCVLGADTRQAELGARTLHPRVCMRFSPQSVQFAPPAQASSSQTIAPRLPPSHNYRKRKKTGMGNYMTHPETRHTTAIPAHLRHRRPHPSSSCLPRTSLPCSRTHTHRTHRKTKTPGGKELGTGTRMGKHTTDARRTTRRRRTRRSLPAQIRRRRPPPCPLPPLARPPLRSSSTRTRRNKTSVTFFPRALPSPVLALIARRERGRRRSRSRVWAWRIARLAAGERDAALPARTSLSSAWTRRPCPRLGWHYLPFLSFIPTIPVLALILASIAQRWGRARLTRSRLSGGEKEGGGGDGCAGAKGKRELELDRPVSPPSPLSSSSLPSVPDPPGAGALQPGARAIKVSACG